MRLARLLLLLFAVLAVAPGAHASGIIQCPQALPLPRLVNSLPGPLPSFLSAAPVTGTPQLNVSWNNLTGSLTSAEILAMTVDPSGQVTETCTGSGFFSTFLSPQGGSIFLPCFPPVVGGTIFENRSGAAFNATVTLENDTGQPATFEAIFPGLPIKSIPVAGNRTLSAGANVPDGAQLKVTCSGDSSSSGGVSVQVDVM